MPRRQIAEGKVRGKGREEVNGDENEEKARQWDESPSGEVKRMETPIAETADVQSNAEVHFTLPHGHVCVDVNMYICIK